MLIKHRGYFMNYMRGLGVSSAGLRHGNLLDQNAITMVDFVLNDLCSKTAELLGTFVELFIEVVHSDLFVARGATNT